MLACCKITQSLPRAQRVGVRWVINGKLLHVRLNCLDGCEKKSENDGEGVWFLEIVLC